MAVFRVEKTKDFTVMSNHHLRNTELSLKAKGLLSLMLSLPEDWDYTTKGLAHICRDGVDSITTALKELERHGYLTRQRLRYENGQLGDRRGERDRTPGMGIYFRLSFSLYHRSRYGKRGVLPIQTETRNPISILRAISKYRKKDSREFYAFLPLNDYMDCLPDYMAAISQNDTMSKAAVTDDGNYAVVRGFYDCISYTNYGLVIRQDWLDDLNMEVPHTYDQLYDVMKAFVSEKGASYGVFVPYTGVIFGDYLVAGYGVSGFTFDATRSPFYQVDGEVKFGAIEDGMKDYLTMMHQWYDEGLVDHDFTSYTANFTYPDDSDITNEEVGIWGCITGLISAYPTWFDEGSSFQLSAMADMVKEEGDMNHFSYARDLSLGGTGIAISANCEDPELAAKFLNYNFTDEGYLLNNYGVEGVSYEYVDGKPQFTEAVTANETMPTNYALAYYAQSTNGAFIIDSHRMDSIYYNSFICLLQPFFVFF